MQGNFTPMSPTLNNLRILHACPASMPGGALADAGLASQRNSGARHPDVALSVVNLAHCAWSKISRRKRNAVPSILAIEGGRWSRPPEAAKTLENLAIALRKLGVQTRRLAGTACQKLLREAELNRQPHPCSVPPMAMHHEPSPINLRMNGMIARL